jgi:MoaA/NifB/PqqE/SkfB family radical SAM enzyme
VVETCAVLGRLLYAPFLVQLVVTRRCNLSCGYCNEYDDVSDPVPTDQLLGRIDKIHELGAFSLELTGGEPMMHPDIAELIAYGKKKRILRLMMITNAFLLNERKIRALNDAGLDHMQISVDGVEPNDVTVKVLRPLKPKLELLAKHAKFRVSLSAVIGSATPAEVLEVVAYAKERGFRPRVLLLHGDDGQLQLGAEELALYKRVKREIGERFDEARDYRTALMRGESAPFKCRAGSRYLYVDELGIVRWCSQQTGSFGVPLADYDRRLLERQFYTKKGCSDHCTIGCARTNSAFDEWRGQHLEPDPSAVPGLVHLGRTQRA